MLSSSLGLFKIGIGVFFLLGVCCGCLGESAVDLRCLPVVSGAALCASLQGHSAPTREELEAGATADSGSDSGSGTTGGPSGRPGDSHTTAEEGVQRNARPGEFAPNDPKKPDENIPEATRETGGQ